MKSIKTLVLIRPTTIKMLIVITQVDDLLDDLDVWNVGDAM